MTRKERMRKALMEEFQADYLDIQDDSARHAGHAGAQPEGETHFKIIIISHKFNDLTRVKRHQRIYQALQSEFEAGLHALNIKAMTPDEAEAS